TKSVRKKLQQEINKVNQIHNDFSVIGVPDPHFEAWLLADEGYVKSYFSLPSTQPLSIIDNSPKDTLEYLQRHMLDPQIPLFQVYEDLASSINLKTTKSTKKDFETFVNHLLSACKRVTH